jgi:hypothetical protein
MTIDRDGCDANAPNCIQVRETWNNCVSWGETGAGKHDDWCRNDKGQNWSHVGQDGGGCTLGWGKGVCGKYMYRGPNCDDWNSDEVWDGACEGNRKIFPTLDSKRKEYCNSNNDRARSDKCVNWCNGHGGECGLRDRLAKCGKYGIRDGDCNDAKITQIENKCISMGFIDQTNKTAIGTAQCNQSSIDTFLKECKTYMPIYITSESGCTSSGLVDAKTRKLTAENAEKSRLQAEKDAEAGRKRQQEDTEKLLAAQKEDAKKRKEELEKVSQEQIVARKASQSQMESILLSIVDPSAIPPELQEKVPYNTTYIIIAIVIVFLLSSSSISILLRQGGK